LGEGGWRGGVKRGRRLGFGRVVGGRGVDEGGRSVDNTKGSEAGKQGGDVAGVRDSEGAVSTVVGKGETEKIRGDGVDFDMI
jgi:hypothetical protein